MTFPFKCRFCSRTFRLLSLQVEHQQKFHAVPSEATYHVPTDKFPPRPITK